MALRNGENGYGLVTKFLHWVTVIAVIAQFVVGLTMDLDAPFQRADAEIDRIEDIGEERAEAEGKDWEEQFERQIEQMEDELDAREDAARRTTFDEVITGRFLANGVQPFELHILLGLSIIGLALLRIGWRSTTPLPPWAECLSPTERRLQGSLERMLLTFLIVVPATGLLLVANDDLLGIHVAAQLAFLATIAVHVGIAVKHTFIRRNRYLRRML